MHIGGDIAYSKSKGRIIHIHLVMCVNLLVAFETWMSLESQSNGVISVSSLLIHNCAPFLSFVRISDLPGLSLACTTCFPVY